jgi:hypothetical protein
VSIEVHTEMLPDAEIRARIVDSPGWHATGMRIWDRSRELAPGGFGADVAPRFISGTDGRLEIFSTRTVRSKAGKVYSLFEIIERGSVPHDIPNAFGRGPFFGIGGRFKGKFHPGTKPNPFAERAMQQIIHEASGIALVHV